MLLVPSRAGSLPGAQAARQGVPCPPAPRGSRRAAPSRRRAVLLQLRPPLNPAVPAPPAASPLVWRGRGLGEPGDPASQGPAPAPRPLGVRLATRPREAQVGAGDPPPWARWSSLTAAVEPGKLGSMTASARAVFGVAPPTSRKLISPPSPRSASSGFGEGQSTAGNFLRCHHTVRPHPGSSGWRGRLRGRGAPRSSGVLQWFCPVQNRGSSPLQER